MYPWCNGWTFGVVDGPRGVAYGVVDGPVVEVLWWTGLAARVVDGPVV